MKNNAQLLMPREKMLKFGISALTDVELLALFLRTGTRGKDVLTLAKEMLENFGSLYGLLTSEYEQFSGVHGIGVAKFAQLKGIAELARRYYNVRMREERKPFTQPGDDAGIFTKPAHGGGAGDLYGDLSRLTTPGYNA